ncbi:hypothetical protein BCR32DRAFT_327311 [Anaeromyces robustus]|uniref:Extracellular membrane protein CFEM domain-containing protein n=1 Tax=Anaeromyces robustus TaxID=1754192 RepID=A0A1Y1X6W4_9FUNG|nr:hypothetical protein BCR32DRAFT_327311 [Anaeromyces robustus]|eukprot:ORX81438.1 hypothetical protein BCR32DRAFT_327311 [Anaeromyces robustus]
MKFSTGILSLFAAASALALPLKGLEKCQSEISNTLTSCTQDCINFNSQRCQSFFSSPFDIDVECQSLTNEEKNNLYVTVKEKQADNNLYCYKDANGNLCPFVNILTKSTNGLTEEIFNSIIKETCKSEKCIDLTIESISNTLNVAKYRQSAAAEAYLDWYKNGIEFLQSGKCNA